MNFVALGHSHVVALAKGTYALQDRRAQDGGEPISGAFHYLYDPGFEPPFVDGAARSVLNPNIADALSDPTARFVLTSIGGNEHNVLSIARNRPHFDFILGEQPDLPLERGAEILPEAAIRETILDWMSEKIAILRALRRATSVPIVQIEPPPPLPREQVLAYPKEFFRSVIDQRKMSPDLLRRKMWRVQIGVYRDVCAELGIAYVPTLPEMIGADGMLATSACGKDATHANEAYGEAMVLTALRRVTALLNVEA